MFVRNATLAGCAPVELAGKGRCNTMVATPLASRMPLMRPECLRPRLRRPSLRRYAWHIFTCKADSGHVALGSEGFYSGAHTLHSSMAVLGGGSVPPFPCMAHQVSVANRLECISWPRRPRGRGGTPSTAEYQFYTLFFFFPHQPAERVLRGPLIGSRAST